MEAILSVFSFISSLGVSVVMPIILTLLGGFLGAGWGKSFRAGLTVGVGFIGLNLVINSLLGTTLAPAVQTMVTNNGLALSIIDIGWPAASAIAMGSQVGILIIPLGLLVNILMLLTNTTQTVDVDIWNYWHFAFTGSLVAIATGQFWMGILAAVINMMIVLILGDITAPLVEESLGMPGISLPHGFTAAFVPIAMAVNWIIDKIPGLNKVNLNLESIQEKFGVLGEPVFIGTVIGVVIGFVAYGVSLDSLPTVLSLGVSLGAVLVLIPKMAALLMEGLIPISDAASEFIQKHFKNRGKMYIGLDSAIGTGHPTTLAMSLILIPCMIILAFIIPGNKVLPFTDLAVAPYMLVLITPVVKNNGFRGLIVGVIVLAVGLLIATNLAPYITEAAAAVGFAMPEGATMISSLCDGANPLSWLLFHGFATFSYIGIAVCGVGALALAFWNRTRILKEAKLLHEAE